MSGLYDCLLTLPDAARATMPNRLRRFMARKMDTNEITVLMQDLLEVQAFEHLPTEFYRAGMHCIRVGLCRVRGMSYFQ